MTSSSSSIRGEGINSHRPMTEVTPRALQGFRLIAMASDSVRIARNATRRMYSMSSCSAILRHGFILGPVLSMEQSWQKMGFDEYPATGKKP